MGPARHDAQALQVLAEMLNAEPLDGDGVLITQPQTLTVLLTAPADQLVTAPQCAWLAWLMWLKGLTKLEPLHGSFRVTHVAASTLPGDWLANTMEQLGRSLA